MMGRAATGLIFRLFTMRLLQFWAHSVSESFSAGKLFIMSAMVMPFFCEVGRISLMRGWD